MELFGENFEDYQDFPGLTIDGQPQSPSEPPKVNSEKPVDKSASNTKSKKSKVVAKSGGMKYQFQIMQALGIPQDEIKDFVDPVHWMKYFPPIAQRDLESFGARIDWRRSFVTSKSSTIPGF